MNRKIGAITSFRRTRVPWSTGETARISPIGAYPGRIPHSPLENVGIETRRDNTMTSTWHHYKLEDLRWIIQDTTRLTQVSQKRFKDRNRIHAMLLEGGLVQVRIDHLQPDHRKERGFGKLDAKWVGPFIILKRIPDVAYELDLPRPRDMCQTVSTYPR